MFSASLHWATFIIQMLHHTAGRIFFLLPSYGWYLPSGGTFHTIRHIQERSWNNHCIKVHRSFRPFSNGPVPHAATRLVLHPKPFLAIFRGGISVLCGTVPDAHPVSSRTFPYLPPMNSATSTRLIVTTPWLKRP